MKKKIFITGISSQILSVLALKIDASLYDIYGFTRDKNFRSPSPDIDMIYGDLLNESSYIAHIQDVDILIHGAAITHSSNKASYYKVNYEATKRLVDNAIARGVKRFVFISSNTAHPKNGAYSHSKHLAEAYIMSKCPSWHIYRISQVFGVKAKDEGIEKLIQQALQKRIILSPSGMSSKLYPIHAEDVASNIIDNMLGSGTNLRADINGNVPFTYNSLIDFIAEVANKRILKVRLPKAMLYAAKFVASILPLGFVPDQVDRLYGKKTFSSNNQISITLEDYIKTQLQ